MSTRTSQSASWKAAKIAGLAYLVIIIAGITAEFFMRSSLIVSGDPSATIDNILESEMLFRSSIALDLIMIGADMVVAMALYVLLRPINRSLALLAALFRVVMDSILGVNLLNLSAALALAQSSEAGTAFESAQIDALAMTFIDIHALGYSVALVPFAFATLIVSYLLYKSKYVPRPVSVLLAFAGLTYLTGSTIHVLAPDFEETFSVAYVVPLIAESALALWLIFKGANIRIKGRTPLPATAS